MVGSDGNVQLSDTPLAVRRAEGENVAVSSDGSVDEHSQFDFSLTGTGYSCGPSPLTTSQIAQLVVGVARRHGVDPDFALAIATTESQLDRDRNSPKGARGPMQLMPSTAAFLGVADICDPAENIDGGVRFLKSLFETYRNPLIVAAAYNAGEANVQKYGGIPPFPETVRFVVKVVNRQLGLQTPRPKDGGRKVSSYPKTDDSAETGVLATGEDRRWVGGVMQF
ncbi:lytic transglycosylase domain-containing protein [Mesorhizobium sp. SARCC-RB16n]|nr:lytic transglycosylase domain-containing protein [Mesorhizobium sp. SARCC-RB16n]